PTRRSSALLDLPVDLGRQRGRRLDDTGALARRTGLHEERMQALPHPLARHLDQAELGDLEHVRAGLVVAQRPLERAEDLAAVVLTVHVDEVDDDDPAEAAPASLPHDLA